MTHSSSHLISTVCDPMAVPQRFLLPNMPFRREINSGCAVGTSIIITAQAFLDRHMKNFTVQLSSVNDIALNIRAPISKNGQITVNARINGSFTSELEKSIYLPIQTKFILHIRVTTHVFEIYFNNNHMLDFVHRINHLEIKEVSIEGALIVEEVLFRPPEGAFLDPIPSYSEALSSSLPVVEMQKLGIGSTLQNVEPGLIAFRPYEVNSSQSTSRPNPLPLTHSAPPKYQQSLAEVPTGLTNNSSNQQDNNAQKYQSSGLPFSGGPTEKPSFNVVNPNSPIELSNMFSDPLIGNSQRIPEESQSTNPVNTPYGRSAVLTQFQYINPPYPVNTPPQQFPYSETAYPQVYHPVPQQHTQATHIQLTPSVNQPQPITYGSAIYPSEPLQIHPHYGNDINRVRYSQAQSSSYPAPYPSPYSTNAIYGEYMPSLHQYPQTFYVDHCHYRRRSSSCSD